MSDPILYNAIIEGLRILFFSTVPVLVALSFAGVVSAVLQSVIALPEPALGYSLRVLALFGVVYYFYPSVVASLVQLSELVYR